MIAVVVNWISRLTAYGWIDLSCDLLLVTGVGVGLCWLHQLRADTRALLHSETYGQHATKRGPA